MTFSASIVWDEILIVDDTKENLQLLSDILNDAGYKVRPATDGETALRSVRAKLPALILLDIKMPGMNGLEVCRQLKADEKTSAIPVIFVSVLEDRRSKIEGFQAGAVDYVNKPFFPEEVLARVQTHLSINRLQLELKSQNEQLLKEIAERKQAEGKLRESEEKYRLFVDTANEGVWAMDAEHRTTFVNQRMAEMLGYTIQEMLGKLVESFMFAENLQDHGAKMEQRKQGIANAYERRFRCKNGREILTQVSATPILDKEGCFSGSHALITDITERKQAEEALREEKDRAQNYLDLAGTMILALDTTGKISLVNKKGCQILERNENEIIGKNWFDNFLPERIRKDVKEIFSRLMNGEIEPLEHVEGFTILSSSNKEKLMSWHNSLVKDSEGKILGILSSGEDITETMRKEEERKQLQDKLQQSQKMEAVGTLAGGIAHDFNNILAVILGNAELASDDIPDWNPASKSLKEIHRASIKARDMVKQLLAFSRKSGEVNAPINIEPIVKESMEMLRTAIPSSVEFSQHISDETCNIMGDAAQINQIMMNLTTNAAHAMSEEGGLLEVTLEKVGLQEEKPCFNEILPPGAYVRLKVRDTGDGIEPEIMTRIFEPYYTTKEVGKGTGMGLSVIHGIVKRHDGGIRVESELGKGTVFEIYFPALLEMIEEEKEPDGEVKGGSERILFVDDEESMVDLNHQRLERLGYQVKSTTKPVEALEWFKADPDRFDVIITDMTMPRMTGDRLTTEILTIRPHMRVIICTGYSERMSAEKAESLGVRKYLEKPIGVQNLAAALREVLEEK